MKQNPEQAVHVRDDRNIWLTVASILSACGLVSSANAASITSSATAPSVGILASQLTDVGPGTGEGGRNYADNGGPPGQTFTVAADSLLGSITVLGRGDSSAAWNGGKNPWDGSQVWGVQIAQVGAGGSLTPLLSETATGFTAGGAIDVNTYLTFNLGAPVSLSAGNTYAFSIYLSAATPGADGGWFGIAHTDTDVYAGGTAFNNNSSIANPGDNSGAPRRAFPGAGFVAPVPGGYDYVFAVQAVPEPGSLALIGLGGLAMLAARKRRTT